ncbi:MAG: hypothetical protein ACRBBZ_06935 [Nitrosopumilus sp.]
MNNSVFLIFIIAFSFSLLFVELPSAEAYEKKSKRFGIDLDEDTHKVQLNKYYNYVHLQPEWSSYPSNLLFDVTIFWNKIQGDTQETKSFGGAKNRVNSLHYLGDRSYIEVQYDYINCNYQWIHYARYGLEMWNSNLDYWSGKQLESGYNSALFSKVPSKIALSGIDSATFLQFIPICTSKDITSFDYGVKINDQDIGFDVYFVPSVQERTNYQKDIGFEHYLDEGCYGLGYTSFSGTCNDIGKNSGLLIVIPDILENPLTKISIKLKETEIHTSEELVLIDEA